MKGHSNAQAYKTYRSTTSCPRCNGSGYIVIEEITDDAKSVYGDDAKPVPVVHVCPECEGAKDKAIFAVKSNANIPSAFYDKRMRDFKWDGYKDITGQVIDISTQQKLVNSFVNDFKQWQEKGIGLYIYSKTKGSGKTMLSSCICNELMDKYPMTTKYVRCTELIDILKAYEQQKDYSSKNPIEIFCECPLLVLDDLGQKQTGTEWLSDILFRIIDARYQAKLVTITTSNIKLAELDIDDRIVSRLNSLCQVIPLPEYSYRDQVVSKDEKKELFKSLGLI